MLKNDRDKHKRFEPKSNGRTKDSKCRKQIFKEVMFEKYEVIENGKKYQKTLLEMVLYIIRNDSINGGHSSGEFIDDLRDKYQSSDKPHDGGFLVVPEQKTLEEYKVLLEEHRIRTNEHLASDWFEKNISKQKVDQDEEKK